ncbi:alpha/beta hydrolase [Actinophytocola sp.]|uniref:alpha/beta fold hydrolase n=1 Tax=Actinophytocola sp. TaxID=1872138 RepID=UPI002D244E33|nr:alpha/beta hydrolase [Actinophytocola sp.]HYQ66984.1 alpha/beta hydrolase [Actinophytocola sp.]
MDSVVVGGVRIAYELAGAGRPVLLLGGTGMPPVAWQACGLVEALARRGFQVVTYAARGVVPSDAPPAPYTVGQLAADAAGLLDALGLRDVAAVGYSLGSFTLESLVRSRPDLVARAVLLAGAGPTTQALVAALAMERELITVAGRIPAAAATFQALCTGLAPNALRDDDEFVRQWREILAVQGQFWTSADGEIGQSAAAGTWVSRTDRLTALRRITVPVLVAAFEHDPLFPPRAGRAAAELLPHGEFVEIPGAAHAGLMTHPEATSRVLVDFLVG